MQTPWGWIAVAGSVTLLAGVGGVIALLCLPRDYFKRASSASARNPRWNVKTVLRNIVGVALLAAGILLSLPGVPGPGIVMAIFGLGLTDLPGKHRLIRAIARRPRVFRSLNWLRRRFHRPDFAAP